VVEKGFAISDIRIHIILHLLRSNFKGEKFFTSKTTFISDYPYLVKNLLGASSKPTLK
jgi:hypothetical protein